MIIFKIIKLLLPIFLLNWMLSEADLVVPGTRASVIQFFEAVQIPTHEDWPESVKNMDVKEIGDELKSVISKYQDGGKFGNFASKAQLSYKDLDEKVLKSNTSNIFDRKDIFSSLSGHRPLTEALK